jgi:hypothetical protein
MRINKLSTKKVFTSIFLFSFILGYNQIRTLDSLQYKSKVDSLSILYSNQKDIIQDHKLATLLALSYYPELKDTRIEFKKSKIKTTLNVRPTIMSLLFRTKDNRLYRIRINNQVKDSIIDFNIIPFNAKIGLLGHELSHIKDYSQKNIFGIIKRLVSYSNQKTKSEYEKEIDLMTIEKGLGWQLYDWSHYVLNKSNAKTKYKTFKKEIYLSPKQIESQIKAHSQF